MGRESGAGGLTFPIKLRCTHAADLLTEPDLEPALARALGRAFARARGSLPADVVFGEGVVLHPPHLVKGVLAPEREATLLQRVRRAIAAAIRTRSLPVLAPVSPRLPKPPDVLPGDLDSPPTPVAEYFDPSRFDPDANTYTIRSYDGGKASVQLQEQEKRFAPLVEIIKKYIEALGALLSAAAALPVRNQDRDNLIVAFDGLPAKEDARLYKLILISGFSENERKRLTGEWKAIHDQFVAKGRPFPAPELVQKMVDEYKASLFAINVIRARLTALDGRAAKLTDASDQVLRDTLLNLGTAYLLLLGYKGDERYTRLAFLESFYRDPSRIESYAAVRLARVHLRGPLGWENFPSIWLYKNLEKFNVGPWSGPIFPGLERLTTQETDPQKLVSQYHDILTSRRIAALNSAVNNIVAIREVTDAVGEFPESQAEVGTVPSLDLARDLAALVFHAQIQLAVLSLWAPLDTLDEIVTREMYLGQNLTGNLLSQEDRTRWQDEIRKLRTAFELEVRRADHPKNINDLIEGWEKKVRELAVEIPAAKHRQDITRFIIEQIPALIVGGGIASGVGAWVKLATNGTRWLIVLAEGASLTLFNTLMALPSGQKLTVGSVAEQLVVNVALSYVGQLFRAIKIGGDKAEGLASSRRILLAQLGVAAGAFATTTVLQTVIQKIEGDVTRQGGESDFTELLTINAILAALGMLVGLAHPEKDPSVRTAIARMTKAELLDYIKATYKIDDLAAAAWENLKDRTVDFVKTAEELQKAARAGTLKDEDFNNWKQKGLDLAKDLEKQLPGLSKILGKDLTPDQIRGFVSRLTEWLTNLTYKPGRGAVLTLPEYVPGVKRAGDRDIVVYDPKNAAMTQALEAAIKRTFPAPDNTITPVPGGGWQVTDKDGAVVLQALPAAPEVARLLPSLTSYASGEKSQAGLAAVRIQTAVPDLESLLGEAAVHATRPNTIPFLLQTIGDADLVGAANASALKALANYLRLGGDPDVLASALRFQSGEVNVLNRKALVETLLRHMLTWDAEAVQGFKALYTKLQDMSGNRLSNLLINREPYEVKAALENIAAIEGRSQRLSTVLRMLTSNDPLHIQGVLRAAAKIAKVRPDVALSFEETVRTPKGDVTRIVDIRVYTQEPVVISGRTVMAKVLLFDVEVKEVTRKTLARGAYELAKDILNEWNRRTAHSSGPEATSPFDSIRWLIRRTELREQAVQNLKDRGITLSDNPLIREGMIDTEMRAMIKTQLQAAFSDKVLDPMRATPEGVKALDDYRKTFDLNLPFLGFF